MGQTCRTHSDQGKTFQAQKKRGQLAICKCLRTHTKKSSFTLPTLSPWTWEGRRLLQVLFLLPWTKKRSILEIRGEKNAVPRVISCSIRRDQRRASPIRDCPRLLPCADRAWLSLISHVEQRSSHRESRGWFFFLSRAVDYHQTKTLNNADNFFLSKSLSTRLGTKPRGTQVCPCNTYTPRAPSACASKPLYPQNGGVGVWAIHGIWWIRTLNNAWKCADIFCVATLRQDFRCRVLSQGSGTIVLAHFQVLSRVCNAMHLDFLKAAYTSLLNSPNCVAGSRCYFCIL